MCKITKKQFDLSHVHYERKRQNKLVGNKTSYKQKPRNNAHNRNQLGASS